ncbi:MAG TPA: ribonuclease Y [Patescibacteria group bacterium]|nr:ribonuclease Y [Patescibacteria group bacterium]
MSPFIIAVLALLLGAGTGIAAGYAIRKSVAAKQVDSAEAKAEKVVKEADAKAQQMVFEAKDKSFKMIEESKREDENRRKELRVIQGKLAKIEEDLAVKMKDAQRKTEDLDRKHARTDEIQKELEAVKADQIVKLESVAGLTKDEAKEVLFKQVEEIAQDEFESRLRKIENVNSEEIEKKAHNLLGLALQRLASSHSVETTTTSVPLPNDEMKGRIIGKEGRNIKAVEHMTGCEIIVDDTPQTITISGFSPIRRQVCKLALLKLIEDGRIHPGRIEEAVDEAKQDLAKDIKKAGEEALLELGIPIQSLDPKLVQILGRLKYRTSYGQNVLRHSMEVAQLSVLMAQELHADVKVCRLGGILHDIGKAVDHDVQGAHPEIGYNIMKKFGLPEEICYQSIGHHEDKPKTLEAMIVKAADAMSGARPGARKDTYELYVQRLEELEKTASSFPGVEKVYAIQAGREVRVFVEPKIVDDFGAYRLARDIAKKIESELKYPGEIRVNVIRETRVVEYAR